MFYCILTSDPISGRREPEFRVESGVLSSWNLSGGAVLTATWDFTLVAINLNDNFDIYFYDIHDLESHIYEELLHISILRSGEKEYYRRHRRAFATAWLGPLSLGKRSETRVNITLPVVREYVGDAVATQISSEEKARGSVNFTLVMEGQYKYSNTSSWYSPLFCSVFHEVDFRILPDNNETEIQRGMPASGVSSEMK